MKSFTFLIKFCCLIICFFFASTIEAQNDSSKLYPYRIGNYYGFSDENSNIIIPADYTSVTPFYENRAMVYRTNYQALINRKGEVIMKWEGRNQIFWRGINSEKEKSCDRYIIIKKRQRSKIFDLNGNQIFTAKYRRIIPGAKGQFICTNLNREIGILDLKEEVVVVPFQKNVIITFTGKESVPEKDEHYNVHAIKSKSSVFYNDRGEILKEVKENASSTMHYASTPFEVSEKLKNKSPSNHLARKKNGYAIYYDRTENVSKAYLLDPTGKIICENCNSILDCEQYFIKYTDLDKGKYRTRNIVDWEGNLFFKNNYGAIRAVNGTKQVCPNRFIVQIKDTYVLINEKEQHLTSPYEDLRRMSSTFLLIKESLGNQKVLDLNGKIIATLNDFKALISDIEERRFALYNGSLIIRKRGSYGVTDIYYLTEKGVLLYEKEKERKIGQLYKGDLVVDKTDLHIHQISGADKTSKLANLPAFEQQKTGHYTSKQIVSFDRLTLIEIEASDTLLTIKEKENQKILLQIRKGDYFYMDDDEKSIPYVVSEIEQNRILYTTTRAIFKNNYLRPTERYSKKVKIPYILETIKRIEKKNYSRRLADFPIGGKIFWKGKEDEVKNGFINQVPIFSDDLVAYEYMHNGKKEYCRVKPEEMFFNLSLPFSKQDTLHRLAEKWHCKNIVGFGPSEGGYLYIQEGETLLLNKNKKLSYTISFTEDLSFDRSMGYGYLGSKVIDIDFPCTWHYEKGEIFLNFGGTAKITEGRKEIFNNTWEHELIFVIKEMTKDEIKLVVKKVKSNRWETKKE